MEISDYKYLLISKCLCGYHIRPEKLHAHMHILFYIPLKINELALKTHANS